MWNKLKKLSEPTSSRATMEIVREDSTISHDIGEILNKWHCDISKLLSGLRENPDIVFDDAFYQEVLKMKNEFD